MAPRIVFQSVDSVSYIKSMSYLTNSAMSVQSIILTLSLDIRTHGSHHPIQPPRQHPHLPPALLPLCLYRPQLLRQPLNLLFLLRLAASSAREPLHERQDLLDLPHEVFGELRLAFGECLLRDGVQWVGGLGRVRVFAAREDEITGVGV